MKGRIKVLASCLLVSQLFLMTAYAKPDWPSDMGIQAEAGIVMDVDSGAVIYGQNIHAAYPPASITKILTALIVLENSSLDEMVTFSKDSVYNVEEGSGNKLNVTDGDQLSVEDCLYSLILHSCNQAANALAEHVAGSREEFVRMMNDKLTELGCTESHFDNPSGLNGDTQYVSAYDMALIAKAAYSNKKMVEIGSAISHDIPPTVNNPEGLTIYNEHRLVKTKDPDSEFYCPSAVAGKTGYLIKAGNTVVTYGEQDGRRLVSVVLKGSPKQYFIDGKNLLEFGFSRFENFPVTGNETDYEGEEKPVEIGGTTYDPSDIELEAGGVVTLPKGGEFSQADKTLVTELPPGSPKDAIAMVRYTYSDRVVGQAYLTVKEETLAESPGAEDKTGKTAPGGTDGSETAPASRPSKADSTGKGEGSIGILAAGIGALLILSGAVAGFFIYRKKKERRAMELRREERIRRIKAEGDAEVFQRMLEQRREKREKK